jgi:excisionase family DNA binding protein
MNEAKVVFEIPLQDLITEVANQVRSSLPPPADRAFVPGNLISEKELSKYLNVTLPTLNKWRSKGKIPFIQLGSLIRYDLEKVVKALEKNG